MNDSEEKVLREVYASFKERLNFEDFKKNFNSLPIDKWNFANATMLYQQYLKCKDCNANIGLVILASCADALQLVGNERRSRANFVEFYSKYCPPENRWMPIEYASSEKRNTQTVPFDDTTLTYIYHEFRCSYIHVGIGMLESLPEKIKAHYHLGRFKKGNDFFTVDLIEFPKWFEKATFESLYALLMGKMV